jgi:hypothetical protein
MTRTCCPKASDTRLSAAATPREPPLNVLIVALEFI